MPFATHRGQRIHYTVEGSGPLVVLLHGLLVDSESWKEAGFVEVLADRYRVVCIDSLAHGLSDRPTDPSAYAQDQRAGDIVAVLDDLGCHRAHLVGHSMGGWLAVGMAKYHPHRIASLTIGAWELLRGTLAALPPGATEPLPFGRMLSWARGYAPSLVAWITPEAEPGLGACWDALGDLAGAEAAVLDSAAPVLLWNGNEDAYHDPMRAFADAHGLAFLSTPGDHMGTLMVHGAESARGVRAFLDRI
jgi:pimeloyl-ACP methyl ester carboxylesterase